MNERLIALAVVAALAVAACAGEPTEGSATTIAPAAIHGCDGAPIIGGAAVTCEVPGWPGRVVDVHVPDGYDPSREWPLVLALHGGGGDRNAAARTTCPAGDLDDPGCLHALGVREGFLTAYPEGYARTERGLLRTWNAGGTGDLDCVSAAACEAMSDDVAYLKAVLDLLADRYSIEARVTATGLSNGGAMSHRLGCELADRIRVVAAVGGANQQPGCVPSRPVSVIQIHGVDDPCWPYDGGELGGCGSPGVRVAGARAAAESWAGVLGCAAPLQEPIIDAVSDGTTATRWDWECPDGVRVALVTIEGGGHTWPQGFQFAPRGRVGLVSEDFSANELIWQFLSAAP